MTKKYFVIDWYGKTIKSVRKKATKFNIVIDNIRLIRKNIPIKKGKKIVYMNRYRIGYHHRRRK